MQKQLLYFSWFSESVCLIISARIVFRFVRRLAATSPIRSEDTFFFPGLQIRSAVRSPASCEIGNGTYSWKFAPAISPVSLQAPKDGIRLPQLSHIFRIHLRTTWLSFSLGKGSAREIPFFLWKNNKEEQAARTFWRSLNHAEPWLSIGCEIFCRQIVYFFCRFKSFSCWLSSNCVVYIKSTCFLYIVDC